MSVHVPYIGIVLVVFILGFITLLLAARAWQAQRRIYAARHWKTTTGQVLQSGIQQTTVRVRISTSVGRYRNAIRYIPHVVYHYRVNGAHYQGERLRLGTVVLSSEARDAERTAARYPVGSAVTVYYDPANPTEAVLMRHTSWGTWLLWCVAMLMLVITIVVAMLLLGSVPPLR
ncbi:MAG: DUF3592 domain-containing protein [Chloroflexaceae bacterium]|jgi:hypothetical protein|nr:DUF3592 domain-containing protein [Chloroflexaceae bacterium]